MRPFPILVDVEKSISSFSGWSPPDRTDDYVWFDAPLEIDGVTEVGLFLHGGAYLHRPERHVSFELFVRHPHARRRYPLDRIDWRCLRDGHTNIRVPGHPLSGKRIAADSHHHTFDVNWSEATGKMHGGGPELRMARAIDVELQSFAELRTYAGKHFKINNIELVLPPEWEYDLFTGDEPSDDQWEGK
jgi:hypothetical protein